MPLNAPSGRTVYVTGSSSGLVSRFDYATIAYDAVTGKPRLVSRNDQTRDDNPQTVAAGPGGGVIYVTGFARAA